MGLNLIGSMLPRICKVAGVLLTASVRCLATILLNITEKLNCLAEELLLVLNKSLLLLLLCQVYVVTVSKNQKI